jgi:hypothetical protein
VLSVLPCSPRCANWLPYGVQPDEAEKDLIPGACKGRVQQRRTLGYTGRRGLVSRNWSNKTLTDHRLDGQEWFRALTAGLLDDQGDPVELDRHRYVYELARTTTATWARFRIAPLATVQPAAMTQDPFGEGS